MKLGALIAFLVKGLGAFSAMVMHVLVARILLPEQAGQFYVAFTTITLISVICRLGLDEVVLKNVSIFFHAQNNNGINRVYKTSFIAVLISSLCGVALLLLVSLLLTSINNQYGAVIWHIAPALVFFSLFTLHAQLLQGRLESVKSTLVLNLVSQCIFSIMILCYPVHLSEQAAMLFNLSTGIACVVGIFFWWNTQKVQLRWRGVGRFPFWNTSRHFWISMIIQQATIWGGQLLAAGIISSSDMASLNLFQRLTSVLQFFLVFASLIYSPRIAALYANRATTELQCVVIKVHRYLLLLSILAMVVGIIFLPFINDFFGNTYGKNSTSFLILLFAQCVNTTLGFTFFILMMCDHEVTLKRITLNTFPLVIISNPLFGYWWGVTGVAVACLMNLVLQNLLASRVVKYKLKINLFR